MLFVEKYRPKEFDDVVGLPSEIPTLMTDLPHLLFIGKPGTGKTTTAKIIISKMGADYIILNASDERGIQTIRDKVKSFAMTQSTNGKYKIVFLDEFDFLTAEAQTSLRNLMETYHSNVRFICTANYENKIIDPLKSRLKMFRFETAVMPEVVGYLGKICELEKIDIQAGVLEKLVEVNKNDMRKCINQLQIWSANKKPISVKDVKSDNILPQEIHQLLLKADFVSARQKLLDSTVEYDVFLEDYHDFIVDLCINKKQLSAKAFANIINALANAIIHINQVISKEIIVENFLLKTIAGLKE